MAQERRGAAGGRPLHIQAPRAAVLPVVDFQPMRSRRELHGPGHRVHAHCWTAFQDGVAVHSKDDAVVGSCIEVNAFGSRREPHTFPANPVVPGRPVSLVDERKIDGRDAFVNDRFGGSVDWIPVAAGEPDVRRQSDGRQPGQRQRDRSQRVPEADAERAGIPTAQGAQKTGQWSKVSHTRRVGGRRCRPSESIAACGESQFCRDRQDRSSVLH